MEILHIQHGCTFIFVKFFDKMVNELHLLIIINLWTLNERGFCCEIWWIISPSLQFTASNVSNSANCNHNLLAEYCKGPFKIENILHLAFLGDYTSLIHMGLLDINSNEIIRKSLQMHCKFSVIDSCTSCFIVFG